MPRTLCRRGERPVGYPGFEVWVKVIGLVAGLICAGLAAVVMAVDGEPLAADLVARDWFTRAGSRPAEMLTQLGAGPVLYPLMLVLVWRRWRQGHTPVSAVLPLAALAIAQVLEGVLFVTVPRPSPLPAHEASSFSSGHAAAAVLAWGLVAAHLAQLRRWNMLIAAGAGLAAGWCRVVLGYHWATDVVAAIAFGLFLLAVTLRVDTTRARTRSSQPPERTALSWHWLLPVGALAAALVALALTPGTERLKDLLVYQGAGGVAGAGRDVYGFRTVFNMPFTYPPFAALLAEPLSRMPIGVGQLLWLAATVAAAVGVCRVVLAPVVARIGLPLTLGGLLLASPMRSHLRFGQVGIFLVLLVGRDLLLPTSRLRRGLGLGLAIAIKLTPVVFLPWMLVTRQRQRLARTLIWAASATLLGLLLLWRSSADYVWHASTDASRFGANDIPGNQSMRGMLLRSALPPDAVAPTWLALALVLFVAGTYGAWSLEREGHRLAAVGVLASLSLAVSPISWVHHFVWLAFPFAALAAAGRWRLVIGWYALLLPGLPSLGAAAARVAAIPGPFAQFVIELQGLTVVAAVLLLPTLVLGDRRSRRLAREARSDAPPAMTEGAPPTSQRAR